MMKTYLLQGIRPLTWWEASEAKKAARKDPDTRYWSPMMSVVFMIR